MSGKSNISWRDDIPKGSISRVSLKRNAAKKSRPSLPKQTPAMYRPTELAGGPNIAATTYASAACLQLSRR